MFNFAQALGLLRLILGIGGGTVLGAHGVDANSLSDVLDHVTTPGGLVLGVLPVIVSGLWTYYAHNIENTVNRAVSLTGGATSPLQPAAKMFKTGTALRS